MTQRISLKEKIDRFSELDNKTDHISRSLLHAYIACLSQEELYEAIVTTIEAEYSVAQAVFKRFLKIVGSLYEPSSGTIHADRYATQMLALKRRRPKLLVRVNTMLSRLYPYLALDLRHEILESWKSEGRRDSIGRWLRAMADDEALFDSLELLVYWQNSWDWRAAKLIAERAPTELVAKALPDLIEFCDDGRIVAKAAIRIAETRPEIIAAIKAKFPASYAYVCAMTGQPIGEDEAMSLVISGGPDFSENPRGLMIWSIGVLGMWGTLDRIREMAPILREHDEGIFLGRDTSADEIVEID